MTSGREGPRVRLRPPTAGDEGAFLQMVRRSHRLHHPWVQPPADPEAYAAYLARLAGERHAGFLACLREDDAIAGVVNLNEIVRGALQGAFLGFYGASGFTGRGLMTEAVSLVLRVAFGELGLHRVEANVQPRNHRSIDVLKRCGFRREGFSPRYLEVAGRWRDHERWALCADDPPPPLS